MPHAARPRITPLRRLHTTRTLGVALAAALLLVSGCKAVTLAYGPDLASARANADAILASVEARFTRVVRTPRFSHARTRIARYALAPSKLANDTSLWTGMRSTPTGSDRELELAAGLVNGQFSFADRPRVPLPTRIGDQRHFIRLSQLNNDDDWIWRTEVDQAIGAMPPARAADIFRALFAAAERPAAAMRADYRAAFPRTAVAMGRMFSVDSIHTTAIADGSTLVALHILVHADSLQPSLPLFAKYVAKYVEPASYRYRLSDRQGSDWFDAQASKKRLIIRFRSRNGELQPLLGAARRMPDTLQLNTDLMAKLGFFTVGVTGMQGEFVHLTSAAERGWALRFTKEPEWHLPLFTERMLHTPLKRPFEGNGLLVRLSLRTGPQGQTLLARQFDVAVRESAIMRFLGNLGFGAMDDYQGAVELEEQRFIAEAFAAMRADIAATVR